METLGLMAQAFPGESRQGTADPSPRQIQTLRSIQTEAMHHLRAIPTDIHSLPCSRKIQRPLVPRSPRE